jgi:hypothetical protein
MEIMVPIQLSTPSGTLLSKVHLTFPTDRLGIYH